MPASDSGPPLRPEGLTKEEQRSLSTLACLWMASPTGRPGQTPHLSLTPSSTGDALNPCLQLFFDWRSRSQLGPTDRERPLGEDQETNEASKAGRSSQPQYQGPYPAHLQDSTIRPCQKDALQPSRHVRTRTVLWPPTFTYSMVGVDICHTRRTRWSLPHASGRQQYCGRRQTVLYPMTWATRLGSTHSHSLSHL